MPTPGDRLGSMPKINAFVTPPYPVLFSVASGGESGVPPGEAELLMALLIAGMPSFLAAHRVPEEALDDIVVSLTPAGVAVAECLLTWLG